jgi:acetyltransferase-like isoleucine patch superfamily enzyme
VNPYRFLAQSPHPAARAARRLYWGVRRFTLPAPRPLVRPALWAFLGLRSTYYFLRRVLFAEPLFKAYCKQYGRNVRTDIYLPWVQGKGDIILGDNVLIDGRCEITFSSRYCPNPTLRVGDHTGIGSGCVFTVARAITIGRHCRLAGGVQLFDSSGHPADPAARQEGQPPEAAEVRAITVEDNVWIGSRAMIFPGVTLGEGCVVSGGAVVMADVPPRTVVAGNPARKVRSLGPAAPANGRAPSVEKETA